MAEYRNPTLQALRHFNHKSENVGNQMDDFMRRHAAGEEPDPDDFQRLLEQKSTIKAAMTAQFNLHQKPLKTVLNETK